MTRVPLAGFDGDWIEARDPADVKTRVWVEAGRAEKAMLAYEGDDGATRLALRGAMLAAFLPVISAFHITDVDSHEPLVELAWEELSTTQTQAILAALRSAFSDEGETAPDPTTLPGTSAEPSSPDSP